MASDPNKNIEEEVKKVLTDKIQKSLRENITMQYVEGLRDRIVKRTRVGIGVNPETGKGERLKPLAPITKKIRKNQARIFSTKTGGKIVWTDGTEEPNLKPKQKKARKESFKAFFGNVRLSSTTTPGKSNLTATGQLLKSLSVVKLKLKNAWGFKIVIGDRRGRDMFGNSSKIGNKELAKILAEGGRNFFGFTKSQRNLIVKEIRNFILKGLK